MMKKPVKVGSWITLNHFSVAEILADAGFDWLCIDIEHSSIDYYEVQLLIAAIQSRNIEAYVRVGENNPRIIKRVLDAGADGIIVPKVNTVKEALEAISAVKYPPKGERGVGLARAQKYGFGFEDYKTKKADNIKIIVQIEHITAIDNLEEIIVLDGIDGTFIGPYDLSGSLGKPGNYLDDDVIEVIDRYEKIALTHDKLIGFHVIQPDYQLLIEKIEKGYNFIAFSIDTIFLGQMAREQLAKLKNNFV